MAVINKSIEIKAPVSRVFAYIDNPKNTPDWLPNMIEVKDVSGSGIGTHFKCSWKIRGIRFDGEAVKIEVIPDKRIVIKTKGKLGPENTWSYNLKTNGDTTILGLYVEYVIPGRILGKSIEKVILKHNERETDLGLMNIKKRLEKRTSGQISY